MPLAMRSNPKTHLWVWRHFSMEGQRRSILSLADQSYSTNPDSHLLPFGNHVTKNFALEVMAARPGI